MIEPSAEPAAAAEGDVHAGESAAGHVSEAGPSALSIKNRLGENNWDVHHLPRQSDRSLPCILFILKIGVSKKCYMLH